MIEIQELTRTYGTRARTVRAVAGITLSVTPGITGVVGPNGAGKSTLLAMVLGFLRPTSGEIRVEGMEPRHYVRKHGASYLPERFRLPAAWPVGHAMRALARLEGLQGSEADERARAALGRVGMAELEHRPMGTLSRGMNQRVGIAQAILGRRRLVVLDEPTEGLDPLWRLRFRELVAEMRETGATVLLASHELPEVERLADRVVVLRDGQLQEVLTMGGTVGPLRYHLDVDAEEAAVHTAFPDAEASDGRFVVTVADHRELSARLAALLEAGATIRAVAPAGAELEERVRRGEPGQPERPEQPGRPRPEGAS